jgi:hypothetical protein
MHFRTPLRWRGLERDAPEKYGHTRPPRTEHVLGQLEVAAPLSGCDSPMVLWPLPKPDVRTCRDPVDPDDLEPDGLRLGEAAIRARLLRLAEARRKGHLDAPRSDLPASFRRFVGPPMKDHGGPPSVTTFGEASGFSPPPSSPSRQLPTSALGAAVQRPSRFAVACAAEAFATPPRRTTSGTTALLAQPKGARHDVAEEREVALGLWMRSPVDDDLAADELIAVFNDVEDDVARVAGQHAAVVGAE